MGFLDFFVTAHRITLNNNISRSRETLATLGKAFVQNKERDGEGDRERGEGVRERERQSKQASRKIGLLVACDCFS